MAMIDVQRWAAFTTEPTGGNPAGLVLDARGLDDAAMLRIAAEVGYAETAFVTPGRGDRHRGIRYFSPHAEVPFCGHATIAAAAAIAEIHGDGPIVFATPVGEIEITTASDAAGTRASFTSVEPRVAPLEGPALDDVLSAIGLTRSALHPAHPPARAFAGNEHPLIALSDRAVFDGFAVNAVRARAVLDAHGWPATIGVLWPERPERWHARHVFPVGAIVEDPATGSGAAATGAWLRASGAVRVPARVTILQGAQVGRPGELTVDIPAAGGITVTGSAVRIG